MQASIDISLYPLAEAQFKKDIWQFIFSLREVEGLKVVTNGMSTQVFGEYDLAVNAVMQQIKIAHQQLGSAVFVCKFIAGERSLDAPEAEPEL
ncbi:MULTISPECIES: hypothetical protein [unclassified Thalassotalea]|uniref:hypothetical protein n=1 Tax=unclassified Thalassotalea TaxID=2614972 RepID=UPI001081C2D1|nr:MULTISPECIES: hypothetical protein [unclassified Thalassotalea]NMP15278.1 hypothetical protein [Thalassotalea sp. Y01]QBY06074.1 hypothetical protein E2K93_17635 [Thalassotalea sp. HSM 43]